MPSYEVVSPLSLYQPSNIYPTFFGIIKLTDSPYDLVKLSATPPGKVPPSVLYLIVYVTGFHFAYMSVANSPGCKLKSVVPSYRFLYSESLYHPPNSYPTLYGISRVTGCPYILEIRAYPDGIVPPCAI